MQVTELATCRLLYYEILKSQVIVKKKSMKNQTSFELRSKKEVN